MTGKTLVSVIIRNFYFYINSSIEINKGINTAQKSKERNW